MTKKWRTAEKLIFIFCIIILVSVWFTSCTSSDTSKADIARVEMYNIVVQENENLKKEVKNLKSQTPVSDATQMEELQEQLDEKDSTIKQLEKRLSSTNVDYNSETDDILDIMFWKKPSSYVASDENFAFYSKCYCQKSKKIKENLTFFTDKSFEIELSNGVTVWLSMSIEQGPVWSTSYPVFQELEETEN